ncbi:MAG: acyltransferase [Ruminococcus sp.]|nr:acyltransferase [Ruminococcus sp.]
MCHCSLCAGEGNEAFRQKLRFFGYIGVHIFFVISGFLMIKSIDKKYKDNTVPEPGRCAFSFVLGKFKAIALPFSVSVLMALAVYVVYNIYMYISGTAFSRPDAANMGDMPFDSVIKSIPEFMGLGALRFNVPFNQAGWYISAMLIAMLPLSYILLRNRDLYVYIFAPIVSVIGLNIMFQFEVTKTIVFAHESLYLLARAVCGICFGGAAWLIYKKLCELPDKRKYRIVVTVCEVIVNVLFFYTWAVRYSPGDTLFCLMLLVPLMIAVPFSEKSYLCEIFKRDIFKHWGKVSLTVYLNHMIVTKIVSVFVRDDFFLGFTVIMVLTAVFSFINMLAVKIIKSCRGRFVGGG